MDCKTANKIRFLAEIILSVVTIGLGIVFILEAVDIYYGGSNVIYSREIVGARLKTLIIPVILWLLLIIFCFVLSVLYKKEEKSLKTPTYVKVKNLRKNLPADGDNNYKTLRKKYSIFETTRLILYGLATAVSVLAAVMAIINLCKIPENYNGEIHATVLVALRKILPYIALSFIMFVISGIYEVVSAQKELKVIKDLLVSCKGNPPEKQEKNQAFTSVKNKYIKNENKIVNGVRIALFAVSVTFIIVGAIHGGASDVLNKAIAICTECIGLG